MPIRSGRRGKEEPGQFWAMNAATIVDGHRFPLRTILGQHPQQVRNAKVFPVAGNQQFQAIPPARSHREHATVNTAVCSAASPRVIDPEAAIADLAVRVACETARAGYISPTMTIVTTRPRKRSAKPA